MKGEIICDAIDPLDVCYKSENWHFVFVSFYSTFTLNNIREILTLALKCKRWNTIQKDYFSLSVNYLILKLE